MGFAPLVPELLVRNFEASLAFYAALGFVVLYDCPEERFAFLKREEALLMIEEGDIAWWTDQPGEGPRGRGINLQIDVSDVSTVQAALATLGVLPIRDINERVYRTMRGPERYLEIMIADPDGYRLRFMQPMGFAG